MKARFRTVTLAVAMAAVAVAGARHAWALETVRRADADSRRHDRDGDWRVQRYYVCQVKSVEGTVTFEVIAQDAYSDEVKSLADAYREACKDYVTARREAKKKKEKFEQPKPNKPAIRKLKSFKTEKAAEEYAEKLRKRWEEKLAKKREKEDGIDLDNLKDDDKKQVKKEKKEGK